MVLGVGNREVPVIDSPGICRDPDWIWGKDPPYYILHKKTHKWNHYEPQPKHKNWKNPLRGHIRIYIDICIIIFPSIQHRYKKGIEHIYIYIYLPPFVQKCVQMFDHCLIPVKRSFNWTVNCMFLQHKNPFKAFPQQHTTTKKKEHEGSIRKYT